MAKGTKTGGRQKGTPNKITADLRALVLGALDDVGGRKYLVKQAEENPNAYMSLLGKCVPKEVTGKDGEALFQSPVILIGTADAPN